MCTGLRFTDPDNHLYFGRNFDVETHQDKKVIVTPRNYPLPYKFIKDRKTKKRLLELGR